MRDINRIRPFAEKLAELWSLCPNLRFTQLIYLLDNYLKLEYNIQDTYNLEDEDVLIVICEKILENKKENKTGDLSINNIIKLNNISTISKELVMQISEEECSELIQAISKELRGKGNRENTYEEIADVLICISWLIQKMGLNENVLKEWIKNKTKRSQSKIDSGIFK